MLSIANLPGSTKTREARNRLTCSRPANQVGCGGISITASSRSSLVSPPTSALANASA